MVFDWLSPPQNTACSQHFCIIYLGHRGDTPQPWQSLGLGYFYHLAFPNVALQLAIASALTLIYFALGFICPASPDLTLAEFAYK